MIAEGDVLTRLRTADPLTGSPLPELPMDAIWAAATVLDVDSRRRVRRHRAVLRCLVAGVAAAAVLAVPVVIPRSTPAPTGTRHATGSWLPNAAAAELDQLATKVTATPLGDRYAYWREDQLALLSTYPVADSTPARYWDARTIQRWQGTICKDRQVESWQPYRFLTPQDRSIWYGWANGEGVAAEDRTAAAGGTHEWVGSQLWDSAAEGEPANPCERGGSLTEPTPAYTSSLPTDPRELLDRISSDLGTPLRAQDPDANAADAVISLMTVPWLTSAQRATLIEAIGLLPQSWTVTGKTTVAGHPAVRIARQSEGVRDELVVVAAAPGIWEETVTLVDAERAALWSGGAWAGLPDGTVVSRRHVTESGIVADIRSTP
ncbi:MAG: hypothetical protein EPO13_12080 [Actinomycetota bacterium]|nr:MAG: hypothetical protein EPO13_12080 [Actinomycetota bacterium]